MVMINLIALILWSIVFGMYIAMLTHDIREQRKPIIILETIVIICSLTLMCIHAGRIGKEIERSQTNLIEVTVNGQEYYSEHSA